MRLKTLRCADNPVRMCTVEITVFVDHLQLYPQTKFQSQFFYFSGQTTDAGWQFFQIDIPVTQSTVIIISCTKPSVIQNKEFHTCFFCFFRNIQDFFFIKIKISSFPVV